MQETTRVLIYIGAAHVAVLFVVVFAIRRLLLSDTMRAVARIGQAEGEIRRKEESIRKEIEGHEKEFAKKKIEAEEVLQQEKESQEKDIGRMKADALDEARRESTRILDNAKKEEGKLRAKIASDMEEKAVDYAGQVFRLVFSERIGQELNRQFIDELIDALAETDADSITIDTEETEFTSSHVIDEGQKQRLENLLGEKFGVSVKIEETVREDLLAGLVMKLGSLEIDGSLLNRYEEAATELKKTA